MADPEFIEGVQFLVPPDPWRDEIVGEGAVAFVGSAPSPAPTSALLWRAFLAGFWMSGEGFNGEWPFNDKGLDPAEDEDVRKAFRAWLAKQEAA